MSLLFDDADDEDNRDEKERDNNNILSGKVTKSEALWDLARQREQLLPNENAKAISAGSSISTETNTRANEVERIKQSLVSSSTDKSEEKLLEKVEQKTKAAPPTKKAPLPVRAAPPIVPPRRPVMMSSSSSAKDSVEGKSVVKLNNNDDDDTRHNIDVGSYVLKEEQAIKNVKKISLLFDDDLIEWWCFVIIVHIYRHINCPVPINGLSVLVQNMSELVSEISADQSNA